MSVVRSEYVAEYNYITRDNYDYLLASAQCYADLLGKPLAHHPGATIGEGIANLYHELAAIIGDEANLNIETEQTRLVFVLWRFYSWGDYYFYWIPARFVEQLGPQLRKIAISFLHQFMHSNGLSTPNNSDDFDMILCHLEERSLDPREAEREEMDRQVTQYNPRGRADRLLRRIETKNYYKRLGPALDRYIPRSEYETELIRLMKRGLPFIGKDCPMITSLGYDPFRDEKNDEYYPIFPEQMIRLTYDVRSIVEDELSCWLQETINNAYEVMPAATLTLRPDGNERFSLDDYPSRLYAYLDDLLAFLTENQEWTRIY